MGVAIDTVLAFSTQGAASAFPTALAAADGDSLQVRSFNDPAYAKLESIIYDAGGTEKFRVKSPMMHDDVTGVTLEPASGELLHLLPREVGIDLISGDTLTVQGGIAAAGTITAGLVVYYSNVRGAAARLFNWADIRGNIKAIKTVEVDLNAVAVGAWTDTLITTTEDQLHAHSDYAVLGYETSELVDIVGVKGQATGNLRVCGPGATSSLDLSEYFIAMSEHQGTPHIPVINADDKGGTYVSAAHKAALGGGAAHVYLVLAELTRNLPS